MREQLSRGDIVEYASQLAGFADPVDVGEWRRLLRILYRAGREDLPLGRLLEGHVDALQIVARYGGEEQARHVEGLIGGGAVFGVWNADDQSDPLRIEGDRLFGAKTFASGAGLITHALTSVDDAKGRQLLLLDLAATPPQIDRSWWRVLGMQRSESHLVSWTGEPLALDVRIGKPGDYVQEPWFSGGALRFTAVQAGGIAAVAESARDHLRTVGRAGDIQQSDRLAGLYLAAQNAANAVGRAARQWDAGNPQATLAHVAAARTAVYEAGQTALTLAVAAVGVQAMFERHPLAQRMSDLGVYLRQPAPDTQRLNLGSAFAEGLLELEL